MGTGKYVHCADQPVYFFTVGPVAEVHLDPVGQPMGETGKNIRSIKIKAIAVEWERAAACIATIFRMQSGAPIFRMFQLSLIMLLQCPSQATMQAVCSSAPHHRLLPVRLFIIFIYLTNSCCYKSPQPKVDLSARVHLHPPRRSLLHRRCCLITRMMVCFLKQCLLFH